MMMEQKWDKDIWIYSQAQIPTRFGLFNIVVFHNNLDKKEHVAIIKNDIGEQDNVPIRIHSECLTSEVLGSLKCDCREQLDRAMQYIAEEGIGAILYLRQEGRGIGLGNKIRAYSLQEMGFDTVQANHKLGYPDDLRQYDIAAGMLYILGVKSIRLLTNNPKKIRALQEYGVKIVERIPIQIESNSYNDSYLKTKAQKSGHLLEFNQSIEIENILDIQ